MSNKRKWVIQFEGRQLTEPVQVEVVDKVVLGRKDANRGGVVDVDLGPHGAAKKGVSRQHATIATSDGDLEISDMKTSNGTRLNNKRLEPGRGYPLKDEDYITLGALEFKLKFIEKPKTDTRDTEEIVKTQTDRLPAQQQTVLIVEDHMEVAQLFSMILQKHDYVTHISRDANRAMRFLQGTRPDAVILDLMLPGMSGIEVCRYIRRDSSLDQTAIVFVSANKNPGTERAAYDSGADAFIAKPVNAKELSETVKDCIRRRLAGEDVTRQLQDKDITKALGKDDVQAMQPSVRDDTLAVVVAGFTDRPFTMLVDKPVTLGRGSYANPSTHTDLSRFNAKEKGVSRIHAKIKHENNKFYVQDMDSMNGTFIEGKQIPPYEPREITSGSEVRMGQLSMTVYFMSEREDT